jgi:hypothetical protein
MNVFKWFKSFFVKKEKKELCVYPPLNYDLENNRITANLLQIAGNLASDDINVNSEGRLEVSDYYNDEKTQFFEFINDISILNEVGKEPVLIKTIQRITIYRNNNGRLINIDIGQPIKSKKSLYS